MIRTGISMFCITHCAQAAGASAASEALNSRRSPAGGWPAAQRALSQVWRIRATLPINEVG